ncbi:MAG: glutamate--cysteine ligase [Methanosphaera sp.]|nr:glutamate--cysteine ligase [Methanosphaera sp.]
MNRFITINTIMDALKPREILEANFGLEKEGLRVDKMGRLALTEHPSIFGPKSDNPYITTDFSESQIEMITPTFTTVNETYQFLARLTDIVNTNINSDEYIWNQSLPCILPSSDKIPIARYHENDIEAEIYREKLASKYGTKKQLISGIHYNISLSDNVIDKLYAHENYGLSHREYKNKLYLKIVKNYTYYSWFIIYITGTSIATHESFSRDHIKDAKNKDNNRCYYTTKGVSLRNTSCGYKNLEQLYPSYNSVDEYLQSINEFIDNGSLCEAKELYTQIRLKTIKKDNYLKRLQTTGIDYVEIRSVDINPLDKNGVKLNDLKFIHLFIIYLLVIDEVNYPDWQKDAKHNEQLVAQKGLKQDLKIRRNNQEVSIDTYAKKIIQEIENMNKTLELHADNIINSVKKRVYNRDESYPHQLLRIYKQEDFIRKSTDIAINNKKTSMKLLSNNEDKLLCRLKEKTLLG